MTQPSCFNCRHLRTWWHPATRWWEPEDSGWECSKELDDAYFASHEYPDTEEEQATLLASQCSSYEYFDWDDYHRAQAKAEGEAEAKMRQYEKDYEDYLINLYNPIPGDK